MNTNWNIPRTEEFIEKHANCVLDWITISHSQHLSESFIEKHADKVNWADISAYQKLSENFITKHADEVNWGLVYTYQKLSEPFIKKHAKAEHWEIICMYQTLSEGFVEENKYLLDWPYITRFQKLSSAFRRDHNIPAPEDNWLYKPTSFKKKAVQDTGLYECHKDYFIAYKAIRKDRYSHFGFQYKYEKGGVYETHADYTYEGDSFGFGAGTKRFAAKYGSDTGFSSERVRVKIYYRDVARIVYFGEKIRACKIEVLD